MNPRKKRILIIGASGFLGNAFFNYFQQNHRDKYHIIGTYCSSCLQSNLEKLDVTFFPELEHFLLKEVPDFILLTAGNKNVQNCEADYSHAYELNTRPVESLIKIITKNKLPTRLLFFSTDYVFDGKEGQYRDDDSPRPSTNYGKTKYLSEQALLYSDINFKIIRTAAVMGKGSIFFDWLVDKIIHEKILTMYDDVFFSPTPLTFLEEMVNRIIEYYDNIPQKIIHIVGEKRLDRYHFALMVKNHLNSGISIHAEKNLNQSLLFKHDLSLVHSDVINIWRNREFEDYLKDEILNDSVRK